MIHTHLKTFSSIAKPFYKGNPDYSNSKENIVLELLKDFNASYVQGVGIIVPAVLPVTKVIISHIDLVGVFQHGFQEDRVFEIKNIQDEDFLYGALDNTITNSFLINAIKELRNKGLAKDVEFVFTEGEETGFTGIREYMKNHFNRNRNPFCINLDVTNDNWDFNASIEFDRPDINICVQIEKALPGKCGFTHRRFPDDTGGVLQGGGNGFSYCIPTQNYCHTYDSRTLVSNIVPYYDGLLYLISDLDCSDYNYNTTSIFTELIVKEAQK